MNSVREILTDLGYQISTDGQNYRCKPLYRESSSSSVLSIDSKTGKFYDFARGNGGSLEQLVRLTLNFEDLSQAENWLKNKQYEPIQSAAKPILKMPKIFDPSDYFTLPHNYWIDKGISQTTLNFYHGKGVGHSGSIRGRYVFLIPNESSEIVGVVGRLVTAEIPDENGKIGKWKIQGSKKSFIYPYFYNRLEIAAADEVILVESLGDMLSLHECDFKNSLVLFGTEISPALISKLISINPKRIIIATNNDENVNDELVGNRAADKIFNKLSKFFDTNKLYKACPTECKDLGELFQKSGKMGIIDWYEGLMID